jgi:hypothetical protein
MLLQEGMIVLQAVCRVLYGESRAFLVVLIQEAADTVIMKKAGGHDLGDMHFLHPLQPAFMDAVVNLAGYVVNDHTIGG